MEWVNIKRVAEERLRAKESQSESTQTEASGDVEKLDDDSSALKSGGD